MRLRVILMSNAALLNLNNLKRVLIIRLSAIGDVVHALPVASSLKSAYPHLEITWVVEELASEILTGNPDLHDVIIVPRQKYKPGRNHSPLVIGEYLSFLKDLHQRKFDLTLDLQGYGKTGVIAMATAAPHRYGWYRLRDGSHLASKPIAKRAESLHRVDWYLDVVRGLGITNPTTRFPLVIPHQAYQNTLLRLSQSGILPSNPYIVVNQAAGNSTRRWGIANFARLTAQLVQRYHYPIVFIGSKPEREECEILIQMAKREMPSEISQKAILLNFAGETSLKELAALLKGCCLHLCGDTGSAHIAAALEVPIVGFYGGTDPAFAGPWGQQHRILTHRELCHAECDVRACFYAPSRANKEWTRAGGLVHSPFSDVPLGKENLARCMSAIHVEEAMERIEQTLSEPQTAHSFETANTRVP